MKKLRKSRLFGILILIIIILVLIISFVPKESKETVKIGVILPLSGDLSYAGEDARNGINLALKNFNNINYELVFEDSKGSSEGSVTAIQKLINVDRCKIIIGEVTSGNTLAIAPIAQSNKVLLLSPTAAALKLNDAGDYIFKFREGNDVHVSYLVNFAIKQGFKKIALIYDNSNDVWVELKEFFNNKFISVGGEIISIEGYTNKDNDFRTQLTKIKSKNPDAVYLAGHPTQVGLILKQAKEIGLNTQFIGSAPLATPKLLEVAGASAEGLIVAAQIFDCDDNKAEPVVQYCKDYKQIYNKQPLYYGAYTYDITTVLLNILEKTKSSETDIIKNELYNVKNYNGVSGEINIDEKGNVGEKSLLIKIIKNGEFVKYEED